MNLPLSERLQPPYINVLNEELTQLNQDPSTTFMISMFTSYIQNYFKHEIITFDQMINQLPFLNTDDAEIITNAVNDWGKEVTTLNQLDISSWVYSLLKLINMIIIQTPNKHTIIEIYEHAERNPVYAEIRGGPNINDPIKRLLAYFVLFHHTTRVINATKIQRFIYPRIYLHGTQLVTNLEDNFNQCRVKIT